MSGRTRRFTLLWVGLGALLATTHGTFAAGRAQPSAFTQMRGTTIAQRKAAAARASARKAEDRRRKALHGQGTTVQKGQGL